MSQRGGFSFGIRIALKGYGESEMLKISTIDTQSGRELILEGRLMDAWVDELRKSWEASCQSFGPHKVVLNLKGVTAISQAGEDALLEIMRQGARFTCRDVYVKYVLDDLKSRRACGWLRGRHKTSD
jgi:hypothetical protein